MIGEANPTIEIDDRVTENDSTYGDELSGYSASLTSSVLNFRKENGRTYHGYRDGAYLLPNDEDEAERLDMLHEMTLTIMDRKLFLAPIGDSPQRAIDLGTGTGIWAIDFAEQFPSAEVTGVDLSPIQPSMVPPNVKFLVDDIEADWVYNQPFDFVHARFLAASMKNYKRLIQQAYNNTVPGGWVEFHDWDAVLYSEDDSLKDTALQQYYDVVRNAFIGSGYELDPGPKLEGWFREVGFENIHVQKYVVPLGIWPKDEHLVETGFEASAMAVLTRYAGWSKDEVTVLVAKAMNDSRNPKIHSFYHFYAVYGQKPKPKGQENEN
ncbi:hypothetical protein T310_1754 [Rasamsonia emersonii CBS 393.64]|uniref:S-adenosyl-L-methionine-dependent methyltransferase n=1 Tax=Rasamsonia emersonii (strain ATCC 16479 / CBS 393.64 / IMI 116815) TaxID=1408163 RepID=A0A0F4Z1J1_RASE3|nr:hypothetical protein T310_1754 [Rasamsonia emersonii CBS 393.64]KKA24215.1 hypothetical protein T310_1754 [Rasamsonia emersonii CBS 393.64]